jgi:dihydroxy-acid dehydratase
MSGTAFGTVVLHISPESAVGGTLALVQNGDMISLDVPNRTLELLVDKEILEERKKQWKKPEEHSDRGYVKLYTSTVQQSHEGADLDFLVGKSGSAVKRDTH